MKTSYIKYLLIFALVFTTFSCADLEVKNLNEPDTERVLATPSDLIGLAGGAYATWWFQELDYEGYYMAMATMADHNTSSWGNSGMRTYSSEPRVGFNNSVTGGDAYVNRDPWGSNYSALSSVNDVLIQIADGVIIENQATTDMIKAWCQFIQGCTHSSLGMYFDQANIINETTDLSALEFAPYNEVSAAALGYFESAIATIDATGAFTLPDGFMRGVNLTSTELKELANFMAARVMILSPRNKTENAAVDWAKVKSFAQNGMDWDLEINSGPGWWNDFPARTGDEGWMRIDHRIMNMFDHTYPSRWPMDNWPADPGDVVTTSDARFASDFTYKASVPFKPDRGYYHFSHYYFSRYNEWAVTQEGFTPNQTGWENSLMEAEAEARGGNLGNAIAILNDADGHRKTRGGLPDIAGSATLSEVLEFIFYERDIDLLGTWSGTSFCDMRRRDMLQRGTILHFPVPGAELEITGQPFYTIQGTPDGVNIAMEGWAGYDGLTSPTDWVAPPGWTPGQ